MSANRKRIVKDCIGIAAIAIVCLWIVYLQFSNPALTQTQLLLEFWPEYLFFIGIMAATGFFRNRQELDE